MSDVNYVVNGHTALSLVIIVYGLTFFGSCDEKFLVLFTVSICFNFTHGYCDFMYLLPCWFN